MKKGVHAVEGQKVEFSYETFDPPLKITSELKAHAIPAVRNSVSFYERLAKGDTAGACTLTLHPDVCQAQWKGMGEAESKKFGEKYLEGHYQCLAVLELGTSQCLLIKNLRGQVVAQFYVQKDGRWYKDDDHEDPQSESLNRLYSDILSRILDIGIGKHIETP